MELREMASSEKPTRIFFMGNENKHKFKNFNRHRKFNFESSRPFHLSVRTSGKAIRKKIEPLQKTSKKYKQEFYLYTALHPCKSIL